MLKHLLKLISLTLNLLIILSALGVSYVVTAETAIPISTKAEFYNIRNNLSGNYYLTCDIEFSSSDFASTGVYYNAGNGFVPIGDGKNPFTGTFDGKGYTVSGIKASVSGKVYSMSVTPVNTGVQNLSDDGWTGDYIIDTNPKPTVSPAVGIFGSNKGVIKNVNIINCQFSARSSNNATLYVGGIVGHNNGSILNCSVNNTLNCDKNSYIGGITGYQSGGSIQNCSVFGKIESDGVFGGVAAALAGGSATECYTDVAFTGTASANFGLVGIDVLENINNCYYLSATELSGVGERIANTNAKDPKAYKNFDFESAWYMSGTNRRPMLKALKKQDITAGDLNADQKINLLDLVLLARYVAEWEVDSHVEVANVDYNFTAEGNDIIDLQDVAYLAKHLAGWNEAVLY